jgi:hypothetical protein
MLRLGCVAAVVIVTVGAVALPAGSAYATATRAPRSSPAPHWTDVNAFDPPNGVLGASFAYDPVTKDIVLFGGASQFGYQNETWTLSGSTWTNTLASGPGNRWYASMAFDPSLNEMVLFGGFGETGAGYMNDTWAWNGKTWSNLRPTKSPPIRWKASMAYDASTHDLVLFGGADGCGVACSDTWVFNGKTWTQAIDPGCNSICPHSPPASLWGSMAYYPATKDVVLFDGENTTAKDITGTWTWNGSAWKYRGGDPSSTASVPAGFYATGMTYDATTADLVLFGGAGVGGYESTTSLWNGSVWTQAIDPKDAHGCPVTCPASPSGRMAADLTYDPLSGDVVLYGGEDAAGTLGDTWFWVPPPKKPTATKLRSSANPVARGVSVTYTATTSPKPAGGTVRFTDGASTISGCSARPVKVATGVATCRVTYHAVGVHKIRARYSGTSAFDGSTSATLTEKVKT